MATSQQTSGGQVDADRDQEIFRVVADAVRRRSRGELLPDSALIAAHPQLMPELEAKLGTLQHIHRSYLAARVVAASPAPASPDASDAVAERDDGAPSQPQLSIAGYGGVCELGSGGQGTVFKAVQESTGRTVAIKVLPGGALSGWRHRARFEREAEILATLNHPNIVGIIDRGRTADGARYIVMNYIDGGCLDEYVRSIRLPNPQHYTAVAKLFIEIARALAAAHAKGVLHRDLKPSNIRVDREGRPNILDFGLARLTGGAEGSARAVTETGEIVGSLPWASPEQVSRKMDELDGRSDVYSLGVMLHQALTGEFPYNIDGPLHQVIDRILHAVPVSPSQVDRAQRINPALDPIVLKALAKSPEQRYASALELVDDLEKLLAGDRQTAAQRESARARWRRMAVAAVIVAACATCAIGGWLLIRPQPVIVQKLQRMINSAGMELVLVPRGTFMMGSPPNEIGRAESERPHQVKISRPFFIGTTEVTQAQYRAVMGALPKQGVLGDDLPVVNVTWVEAIEFCQRLSQRPQERGRTYQLPTEAHWEYACRAGKTGRFSGTGRLEEMGWFDGNTQELLHPVGGKTPNQWGLHDMHGSVREWCEDYWSSDYPAMEVDPVVTREGAAPRRGEPVLFQPEPYRVVRGGSSHTNADRCRSAARECVGEKMHSNDLGFRVMMVTQAN